MGSEGLMYGYIPTSVVGEGLFFWWVGVGDFSLMHEGYIYKFKDSRRVVKLNDVIKTEKFCL